MVLLVQIFISMPRWNLPFVDTRLHWYFDNAYFLRMAVHSADDTLRDVRKIFGGAMYEFNDAMEPVKINFYNHHGVLSTFLHLQFGKLVGFRESTPRIFSLILSLISSSLLFLFICNVLKSRFLAFALTLIYISIPLRFGYMDQMKQSNMETFIFCGLLFFYSMLDRWRFAPAGFLACLFLVFQTDYPIFLPVVAIACYLLYSSGQSGIVRTTWFRRAMILTVFAGILTTALLQFSLGFTWANVVDTFSFRSGIGQERLTLARWFQQQWFYAVENFGQIHLVILGTCLLWTSIQRSLFRNFWIFAGVATVAATFCYLIAFRNQSFIHNFLQWHAGTGYILILIGFADVYGWKAIVQKNSRVCLLVIPLLVFTFYQDLSSYARARENDFGTKEDLAVIQNITQRIVFFENGASGPSGWWEGPGIALYRDPIYTRKKAPFPVAISAIDSIRPGDVIVCIHNKAAFDSVSDFVGMHNPGSRLEPYRSSPSFNFYTINVI